MLPLLPLHWEMLALDRDKVPLAPQWHVYDERDARGELHIVVLRQDGRIIGYYWGFIAPGLHYASCLTATMDIFFVLSIGVDATASSYFRRWSGSCGGAVCSGGLSARSCTAMPRRCSSGWGSRQSRCITRNG